MNKDLYFTLEDDFESIIKNTLSNVTNIKKNSTGWTNIVFEVEAEGGTYFFRFPRDDFWSRTIVKDYEFSKFIKDKTTFKTPELMLKFDGIRPFSVHKKIPGVPLAEKMETMDQADVDKVGKDISKFMTELHSLDKDSEKIFNKADNIGLNLPDFLEELLSLHVSSEDMKFWKEISLSDNNSLVHGDFNSSNVLLDENNNVSAVIDFGFAGYGNKYDDIARIIGRCPDKFKASIVKGYEDEANVKLDMSKLDQDIDKWNKIDSGYINYMRKIGIYD